MDMPGRRPSGRAGLHGGAGAGADIRRDGAAALIPHGARGPLAADSGILSDACGRAHDLCG
jgi:hypothetical protein